MPTLTTQEQIAALQEQIDAIQGNVDGVTPESCNIASLQSDITELKEQIRLLRISQVADDNPFNGTTMNLRVGAGNIPTLAGVNPSAVALINATGVRPAAIVVGDVTVSVSGGNAVVVSVPGETEVMEIAEKLSTFASDKHVTVDVTQVQSMKANNVDKAEQFQAIADILEDVIETFVDGDAHIVPLKPDIGTPDVIKNDLAVFLDVVITGVEPITVNIDWGDSNSDTDVQLPADHTYAVAGDYTITITATNAAGSDTKTIEETVEESD